MFATQGLDLAIPARTFYLDQRGDAQSCPSSLLTAYWGDDSKQNVLSRCVDMPDHEPEILDIWFCDKNSSRAAVACVRGKCGEDEEI